MQKHPGLLLGTLNCIETSKQHLQTKDSNHRRWYRAMLNTQKHPCKTSVLELVPLGLVSEQQKQAKRQETDR